MKYIYICAIKIIGFSFAVLTVEEADKWVSESPESNYYDKLEIKTI